MLTRFHHAQLLFAQICAMAPASPTDPDVELNVLAWHIYVMLDILRVVFKLLACMGAANFKGLYHT